MATELLYLRDAYAQEFDAVVAGPGPGHPANASDVGLIGQLWNAPNDDLIPVLGICPHRKIFTVDKANYSA